MSRSTACTPPGKTHAGADATTDLRNAHVGRAHGEDLEGLKDVGPRLDDHLKQRVQAAVTVHHGDVARRTGPRHQRRQALQHEGTEDTGADP